MQLKLYSQKIFFLLCVLAVVIQTLFLCMVGVSYYLTGKRVYSQVNEEQQKSSIKNMNNMISQIRDYERLFSISGLYDYTRSYWNLKDQIQAEKKYNDVSNKINQLFATDRYAQRFYVLGKNSNQKSFGREQGVNLSFDVELPTYDDLTSIELESYLYKYYNEPFLFEYNLLGLPDNSQEKIRSFLQNLNDKIIYCSSSDGAFIIIVINRDVVEKMFFPVADSNFHSGIFNDDGNVIYQSNKKVAELIKNIDLSEAKDMIAIVDNQKVYVTKAEICRCYLVMTPAIITFRSFTLVFYSVLAAIFAVFVLICGCLAKWYSERIVRQYKSLNTIFQMHAKDSPLSKIKLLGGLDYRPSKKSFIKKNIFYTILISVILPALISGILYSILLNSYTEKIITSTTSITEHQMVLNILNKTDNLIKSTYTIPEDEFEKLIQMNAAYMQNNKDINDAILSHSMSFFMFYNFVFVDRQYNLLFQTTDNEDAGQQARFKKHISEKLEGKNERIFFLAANDIFEKQSLILVNRIRDIGFFLMFLKLDSFNGIKVDPKIEFLITDTHGAVVAQSTENVERLEKLGANIITVTAVPELGWTLYTFREKELFVAMSNRIFQQNIIIVLAILLITIVLSWWYSFRFVSPLEKMSHNFSAENVKADEKKPEDFDEISEVIHSYNKLIERINNLIEEQTNMKLREQELLALKTRAELDALQHQINPHFLFNTLELVNLQAMRFTNDKASKIIVALTKLFRYSIGNSDEYVALEKEIEHIQNYMMIQEMRFEGRFFCEFDIAEETKKIPVLKLTIQPLIENAISHGLADYDSDCKITVSTRLERDMFIIEVADNGAGMSGLELDKLMSKIKNDDFKDNKGIGLRNVYRRIKLNCGEKAGIVIKSTLMKGTVVRIIIPYV